MRRALFSFAALLLAFVFAMPATAATVSTKTCSEINPYDGETTDWEGIPYLVDDTVDRNEGTLYYLDSTSNEWTTTEPANYRYSANLDQWSKIEKMKTCNTAEDFFMTMSGGWPMFALYDNVLEGYLEIFVVQGLQQQEAGENGGDGIVENPITLPEDWNYWMVWKMQKADGTGGIVYFAADVGVTAEMTEWEDDNTDHPQLYLYEESGSTDSFEDADFNPNTDTLLTTIAVSDTDAGEEDTECQEGDECDFSPEDYLFTDLEDQAFEVVQDITDLFDNAPFGYSDSINMSVAMYDENNFSSQSFGSAAVDESDAVTFKFSKRGVLNARALDSKVKKKSAVVKWKNFKTKGKKAKNYEVRVYNDDTGKLVKRYKKVKKNRKKVKGLKSGKSYRVIVRARKKGKFNNKKKRLSAWSSSVRFTTD